MADGTDGRDRPGLDFGDIGTAPEADRPTIMAATSASFRKLTVATVPTVATLAPPPVVATD